MKLVQLSSQKQQEKIIELQNRFNNLNKNLVSGKKRIKSADCTELIDIHSTLNFLQNILDIQKCELEGKLHKYNMASQFYCSGEIEDPLNYNRAVLQPDPDNSKTLNYNNWEKECILSKMTPCLKLRSWTVSEEVAEDGKANVLFAEERKKEFEQILNNVESPDLTPWLQDFHEDLYNKYFVKYVDTALRTKQWDHLYYIIQACSDKSRNHPTGKINKQACSKAVNFVCTESSKERCKELKKSIK